MAVQEMRRLAEMRAQAKESLAVANHQHRQWQIDYMRTHATVLQTTATDRARAKERATKVREQAEKHNKGRSADSRYAVAQQAAEERARRQRDAPIVPAQGCHEGGKLAVSAESAESTKLHGYRTQPAQPTGATTDAAGENELLPTATLYGEHEKGVLAADEPVW